MGKRKRAACSPEFDGACQVFLCPVHAPRAATDHSVTPPPLGAEPLPRSVEAPSGSPAPTRRLGAAAGSGCSWGMQLAKAPCLRQIFAALLEARPVQQYANVPTQLADAASDGPARPGGRGASVRGGGGWEARRRGQR